MEARIRAIMSSVFGVESHRINDDTSPETLEVWDSLKHMNLVLALEEEFQIQFDEEDIMNMLNFKLIKFLVNERISH
jgi:acyl carrier protein